MSKHFVGFVVSWCAGSTGGGVGRGGGGIGGHGGVLLVTVLMVWTVWRWWRRVCGGGGTISGGLVVW